MSKHAPPSGTSSSNATPAASSDPLALPPGSVLSEFRVSRVLGSGGFGIVYLAHDDSLHRDVAIKEYLPASLAGRTPAGQVVARSAESEPAFRLGLKSFVNEARLLARFDHPSLVKVHRFWEDRGTAYMAMPYYTGATLRRVRKSVGEPPDQAWLKRLLDGLLGALDALHRADIVHRDVAPDNILVLDGGAPLLLDFGAARHVLAEQPQALTAMLKPTYAPIEQYAASAGAGELRQGPWTDLYATAATLHYCLTGEAPPTATARTLDDRYLPLHQRADLCQRDGQPYDGRWLAAIDWALEVLPARRPQSVAQWRAVLNGRRRVARAKPSVTAAGQVLDDAVDDFPAHEVHARQWVSTPSEAAVADVGVMAKRVADVAATPQRAAADRAPRHSAGAGRKATVGWSGARDGELSGTAWARGGRMPLLAAGAIGLVAIVGFTQFRVLPQPGLASPAAMAAGDPIDSTAKFVAGAGPSGTAIQTGAIQTALSSPTEVPADLPELKLLSSHGSDEINETAAEQGRVITVPPRSFDTQGNDSAVGLAPRAAADGSAVKPTQRQRTVERTPVSQTPREFCEAGDRGWFSRMACMRRSCELTKWREHAQCADWRQPSTAQRVGDNDAY